MKDKLHYLRSAAGFSFNLDLWCFSNFYQSPYSTTIVVENIYVIKSHKGFMLGSQGILEANMMRGHHIAGIDCTETALSSCAHAMSGVRISSAYLRCDLNIAQDRPVTFKNVATAVFFELFTTQNVTNKPWKQYAGDQFRLLYNLKMLNILHTCILQDGSKTATLFNSNILMVPERALEHFYCPSIFHTYYTYREFLLALENFAECQKSLSKSWICISMISTSYCCANLKTKK